MALLVKLAEVSGARRFIDIEGAHIDGCLYHGKVGIDFVRALCDGGSAVAVPTTLNVASLDLLHPDLYRGSDEEAALASELMELHVELGCRPTWTCAPYQLVDRPDFGSQIAWGESNAIVFANSVLGARTNRYGDFADLACAITGRAPYSGFHTDEGRLAEVVVEVDVPDEVLASDFFYPLFGLWLGANVSTRVPAVVGLSDESSEDQLKALGAAAASSGATALFHAIGVTPEAPDLSAVAARNDIPTIRVNRHDLAGVREAFGSGRGKLGAISVGTPHLSKSGFEQLVDLVGGARTQVPFYVNTGRDVFDSLDAAVRQSLDDFGATVVTDTCTYITPIMDDVDGAVMTDSGKWAYYAPGNLGVDVVFASLRDCVASASVGTITFSDSSMF